MEIPIGPQGLSYRGTHRSSRAILVGGGVLIGPQGLLYRGTHRSSRAIIADTHRSSTAIIRGYS